MIPILTLLTILLVSMLMVRVASVALVLTGVTKPLARFQARSAFTGAGFTTTESERVVTHPVRRRIIMTLMLLGNAGIVTTISALIVGLVGAGEAGTPLWVRVSMLTAGIGVLWLLAHSKWIERHLERIIANALKRYTDLDVRDYARLLHLSGDYGVSELTIEASDWLADQTLKQVRLADEGLMVLGIQRADGGYLGAPRGEAKINPGDTLILYGSMDRLTELDRRRAGMGGNLAHAEAIAKQKKRQREEQQDTPSDDDPNEEA